MAKKRISGFLDKELLLFSMISDSLGQAGEKSEKLENPDSGLLHELMEFAAYQSVLPVIFHRLSKEKNLEMEDRDFLDGITKSTAAEFYQILFNARSSIELLRKNGIPVVLLKGAAIARFYPFPESRKSSDIDLFLLHKEDADRSIQILEANGFQKMKEQHSDHHVLLGTPDRHALELHTMLIKSAEDKKLNQYVAERFTFTQDELLEEKVLGFSLPVFADDSLALHLLLHMRMEFLSAGFGLKLLCDWVVFWNRKVEAAMVETFLQDVERCGLKMFLSVITSVCTDYLGLRADGRGTLREKEGAYYYETGIFCKLAPKELIHDFLQDVLDAERHGKPEDGRMLALPDSGLLSYIRSFHHLTEVYFPKASRWMITLPFLYLFVFLRFLYQNQKLRGGLSVSEVISSTKKRSRLAKEIFSKIR